MFCIYTCTYTVHVCRIWLWPTFVSANVWNLNYLKFSANCCVSLHGVYNLFIVFVHTFSIHLVPWPSFFLVLFYLLYTRRQVLMVLTLVDLGTKTSFRLKAEFQMSRHNFTGQWGALHDPLLHEATAELHNPRVIN